MPQSLLFLSRVASPFVPAKTAKRMAVLLCALMVLLSISACGSKDDDEELSKPIPLEKFDVKAKLKSEWSANMGPGQGERYDRLTL
ncbi:MAG: hypothetical protein P8I62_04110, partial [Pseudomonadales bacterium]|nr:hypothetical protein [Pseudomonadales bacterium]